MMSTFLFFYMTLIRRAQFFYCFVVFGEPIERSFRTLTSPLSLTSEVKKIERSPLLLRFGTYTTPYEHINQLLREDMPAISHTANASTSAEITAPPSSRARPSGDPFGDQGQFCVLNFTSSLLPLAPPSQRNDHVVDAFEARKAVMRTERDTVFFDLQDVPSSMQDEMRDLMLGRRCKIYDSDCPIIRALLDAENPDEVVEEEDGEPPVVSQYHRDMVWSLKTTSQSARPKRIMEIADAMLDDNIQRNFAYDPPCVIRKVHVVNVCLYLLTFAQNSHPNVGA